MVKLIEMGLASRHVTHPFRSSADAVARVDEGRDAGRDSDGSDERGSTAGRTVGDGRVEGIARCDAVRCGARVPVRPSVIPVRFEKHPLG